MKHRRQTQHIRRYRSGRWTCVNKGIHYKQAPRLDLSVRGFEALAKRVLDDDFKAGKITGTEYNERLAEIRRRASLERVKSYGSFDIKSKLKDIFPRKRYESWEDYKKRITFLDKYYFEQRVLKENIRNLPPLGKSFSSGIPLFIEKGDESDSFTKEEINKRLAERGLPIMRGASRAVRVPRRTNQRGVLKLAKAKPPKFTFKVPHSDIVKKEIEEREKRGERIPEDFYDSLIEGTETLKYVKE